MMKVLFLALLLGWGSLTAYAQTSTFSNLLEADVQGDESTAFFVPGWLLKASLNVVLDGDEDSQEAFTPYQSFVNGLGSLRFFVAEEAEGSPEGTAKRFVQKLRKRDYVPLFKVRSKGSSVNILLRSQEQKDESYVKSFILVVESGRDLVVCFVHGRWRSEELQQLLQEEEVLDLLIKDK